MGSQTEVESAGMPSADHHQNPKLHHHTDHHPSQGDPETHSNGGNNNNNNNSYAFPNLGRQSSIYSLTLDEFQHTLCENGKNFGSMNMDEFLNSIWTAEENQAHQAHHHPHDQVNNHNNSNSANNSAQLHSALNAASSMTRGMITKQPSLPRQGSLSLPAPLCRKTVDEVWSEIQRTHQQEDQNPNHQSQSQQNQSNQQQVVTAGSTQRQPTFGEMTLEDFLIKAGVVREQCGPGAGPGPGPGPGPSPGHAAPQPVPVVPPVPAQHHPQYGFGNPHSQIGPSFVARPMMPAYQGIPVSTAGETTGYAGNGKRNNGYPTAAVAPSVAVYGGRVNNGGGPGGGFGAGLSPVSPVSPDGLCGPGPVDNSSGQYGMELAVLRGRKRIIDGPVEKVVERRQRRMIKNRESAARSRARKQAYTVELEAELNQLREENAQLKQALAEIERQRKQQYLEEQKLVALNRAQRAQEKLRTMRRSRSWSSTL